MTSVSIATTVEDALAALAAGARPIAGGTDLVVGARQGKAPLPDSLVAIDRLAELRGVEATDDGTRLRIGACTTHDDLTIDPLVLAGGTAIADGAALVGSPATRNLGTIGGNVMNGSPAMDTGAPLAVLGAEVELRSLEGSRTLPIGELWTGPGATSAEPGELCTAVLIEPTSERAGSAYVRLEYRRAMEIAVVGAAAAVSLDQSGAIVALRVALTAVAPTIVLVGGLDELIGAAPDGAAASVVAEAARDTATPIADLRAGEDYRRHTVGVMAARAVDAAARRARGEPLGVPVNRAIGIGA